MVPSPSTAYPSAVAKGGHVGGRLVGFARERHIDHRKRRGTTSRRTKSGAAILDIAPTLIPLFQVGNRSPRHGIRVRRARTCRISIGKIGNIIKSLGVFSGKFQHFLLIVLPRFTKSDYIIHNAHDTRVIRLSFERFACFASKPAGNREKSSNFRIARSIPSSSGTLSTFSKVSNEAISGVCPKPRSNNHQRKDNKNRNDANDNRPRNRRERRQRSRDITNATIIGTKRPAMHP